MKKSALRKFKPGSAEYVIAHAQWQRSRGKQPSMPFRGEHNPKKALAFVQEITRKGKSFGHRTLKRVPMEYEYTLGQTWKGYVNPYPGPLTCNSCEGTGYNAPTKQLAEDFYSFSDRRFAWHDKITQDEVEALVAEGRLWDYVRTWKPGKGWQPKRWETKGFWCPKCHTAVPQLSPEHKSSHCTNCDAEGILLEPDDIRLHIPLAEEINAAQHTVLGHDAINRHILVETRAKRLGVFGLCPVCKGKGELPYPDKSLRKLYHGWKEFEPPEGEGFQLWESTSEGSPVSPVFSTAEELANWCAENATIFGSEKTTREKWLRMFIGDTGLEAGSILVVTQGYIGSVANLPGEAGGQKEIFA